MMKPFLKWAGGKRQLIPYISEYINSNNISGHKYYEPFLGGGSVFFNLGYENCCLNDLNSEIINCYKVIKNDPEKLIKILKNHAKKHCKEYYYKIRELDRLPNYNKMNNVEKAARTIYLNRTCYNGLYRVNRQGYFNTPIGKYVNPLICDEKNILEISNYFKTNNIEFTSKSFEDCLDDCVEGDWIYFDPPYDYETSGFVGYVKEGFTRADLLKLKEKCDQLIEKGCFVLISNNDTQFVRDTFVTENYKIIYETKVIRANRNINSKGNNRTKVDEVLIYGSRR